MARIYTRADRRGRNVFYVDYTFEHPDTGQMVRKRERVGYSRRQAEAALQSRQTDAHRKKFDHIIPEPTVTLSEIKARYLRHSKKTKSELTHERERGVLKRHLIPFFKTPLNKITEEMVEDYRDNWRIEASNATINKEVQLLKYIIKKATSWGKIRTNRIGDVKPLKIPSGRVRYLKLDQVPRLLKACPAWLRPIVIIYMNTGLRRSELLSLKRQHIDRKHRLILLENTKNGERRNLPMNRTVLDAINAIPHRLDTPYLFPAPDGSQRSPGSITAAFRRAVKKAKLEDFRLHDLRHHFASYLAMNGHSLRTIQELLGHKDPKMSMRYSHLSDEHLKAAVDTLDNLTQDGAGWHKSGTK